MKPIDEYDFKKRRVFQDYDKIENIKIRKEEIEREVV